MPITLIYFNFNPCLILLELEHPSILKCLLHYLFFHVVFPFNYIFVNLFGCQGESSSQMVRLLKILSGPKIYHLRHINVHFIFLSDLCFFEKGDPIHSCKRFNICFVLTSSLSFYEEVKERAVLKW